MTGPRIPLCVPHLAGREREYLSQCVDTNFVSSVGPFVTEFETEFAAKVVSAGATACGSGTAAIHLALLALGVGADPAADVLVSDLTFVASANPIRYCGAPVTLVDSETETWNLDPDLVREEFDRRLGSNEPLPAAIEVVHLLGHPADLGDLLDLAAEYGVPVIEDASESLGAGWTAGPLAGRSVGAVGDAGCFSFNGNKVITSGGGGMVVSQRADVLARVKHLSTQARVPGPEYIHDEVGFNYRLSNVAAALGLAQLEQLDGFVARKRAIAAKYDGLFSRIADIGLPPNAPWASRASWLYSILLPDRASREHVRLSLAADGIETRPIWVPMHEQAPYRTSRCLGGKVSRSLAERALSLPSSVALTDDEVDEVGERVLAALEAA